MVSEPYVFEQNQNGGDDNTYEWCASGVHPEKENLQNLPPEVCAKWYRCFEEGKDIMIQDLEEIKEKRSAAILKTSSGRESVLLW